MKKGKTTILALTLLAAVGLSGCGGSDISYDPDTMVQVKFELEDGTFKNSKQPVVFYFEFEAGTANPIPECITVGFKKNQSGATGENYLYKGFDTKYKLTRDEYYFDGWYREKTVVGDLVEYTGKWDFEKDLVTDAGVTLYAKWNPVVRFTYSVCYYDESGNQIVAGTYNTTAGGKFEDFLNYATKREGYTFTGFTDENGNPWDESFGHPGGDKSLDIKVIANYTKGEFAEVSTAEELVDAIKAKKDIRLMQDIDFAGGEFGGFGDFKRILEGNNHTVRNFKLTYDATVEGLTFCPALGVDRDGLFIGIFRFAAGANISDVNFENVTVDVDTRNTKTKAIYVAPLCVTMEGGTSVKNVSVSVTYTCTALPPRFDRDNLIATEDRAFCYRGDDCVEQDVRISVDNRIDET